MPPVRGVDGGWWAKMHVTGTFDGEPFTLTLTLALTLALTLTLTLALTRRAVHADARQAARAREDG